MRFTACPHLQALSLLRAQRNTDEMHVVGCHMFSSIYNAFMLDYVRRCAAASPCSVLACVL